MIDTRIELETGAVGDPVTGKIYDRLKVDGKQIPKGAQVSGRLIRLDHRPNGYALGIRFTDITWDGFHAHMDGYLDRLPAPDLLRLATVEARNPQPGAPEQKVIMIPRPGPTALDRILTYWKTF